jgi:hypothetical protein
MLRARKTIEKHSPMLRDVIIMGMQYTMWTRELMLALYECGTLTRVAFSTALGSIDTTAFYEKDPAFLAC